MGPERVSSGFNGKFKYEIRTIKTCLEPTREDRANVTEDELRDFLQKIFTELVKKM